MDKSHWAAVLWAALFILGLLFFVLHIRPQKRLYRCVQRIFWAFFGVWLSSMAGVMGLNPVTLSVTALFGLPGMGALMVIAHL